jgi:hypothetical protein
MTQTNRIAEDYIDDEPFDRTSKSYVQTQRTCLGEYDFTPSDPNNGDILDKGFFLEVQNAGPIR